MLGSVSNKIYIFFKESFHRQKLNGTIHLPIVDINTYVYQFSKNLVYEVSLTKYLNKDHARQ